ncbi:DUF2283 domain-containing protein [Nonomuraea turkmeniaca]|uniref:DUF2283 domain-containing protein n=1 Tax=Nonomuraea turkmeniaca TaxID=103838 RepID=A0A5S4FLT7_9ACTN|nr:DUF2283 domain-containing protein [Nonomuraea turkmeniaca]TMR21688.1 DUF2283 domain-containing protein [Nonomuraea turkmeniaca]
MRIEHDDENDVAYIYLVEEIGQGEAESQFLVEREGMPGEVVLDFDAEGRLLGLEVIGASAILRPEVLAWSDEDDDEPPSPPAPYGPVYP